jgi:hypothetical protein
MKTYSNELCAALAGDGDAAIGVDSYDGAIRNSTIPVRPSCCQPTAEALVQVRHSGIQSGEAGHTVLR